ncbi:MAG: M48 family metallopeptidase [Betaproteobacteria bacterium]|nr:M48 family metallopeptidase [Betaproteobacteria bacterium]MDH3435482.1 M48 family metallopeptidase [Betaproteobacteria bacterium]
MRTMAFILRGGLLAWMLALTSCQTVQTTRPGAVGVDRQQTMLVSSEQVNKSAVQAYRQELKKAAAKGALNRDPAQVARVRVIALRLAAASGAFRPDAPRWAWESNVITSKEINAWCMPGGKMAVYSGLIDRLRVTDDELAAVMGHEIAHALREHGRERASQAMAQGLALSVLGAAVGASNSTVQLAQVVTDVTINLPNSRGHEQEADRVGVELAARAGYDPRAAVTLWQKMARASGGGPPQFLSTHPSPQNRIRDLQGYAAKVIPLYEASRRR